MSKKEKGKRKKTSPATTNSFHVKRELWMLRLKVSIIYILFWFVAVSIIMSSLPDPISASTFYSESKAHWMIHAGMAIMFVVIQLLIGRYSRNEEETTA